jgi:hypothetical protein
MIMQTATTERGRTRSRQRQPQDAGVTDTTAGYRRSAVKARHAELETRYSPLLDASNDRLEELFRGITPGDIPQGPMEGVAIIGAGTWLAPPLAVLIREFVWRGKIIDPKSRYLTNRMTAFDVSSIVATVDIGPSWLDDKDCIVLDYSKTSVVAGGVRDELRQLRPELYLGLIWLYGRRLGWFTLKTPEHGSGAQISQATEPGPDGSSGRVPRQHRR